MKMVLKLFLAFSIFMSSLSFVYGNTEDLAREMFRASGVYDMMDDYMEQIISTYKTIAPDVPNEVWDKLKSKLDMNKFLDIMIPIYAKHFTEEELNAIIKFYNTPEGKKLVEKTPLITQEIMQEAMNWGVEIGKQIMEELEKEGYSNQ